MQARIEKIGDHFGLMLPKHLVELCGLGDEVNVTVHNKTLMVTSVSRPSRLGWEEAIRTIPQESLDQDYQELRDFREMPED